MAVPMKHTPRDIPLDARDGNQVWNPNKVSVLTGEPDTWLLIYTGIGIQGLNTHGESVYELGIDIGDFLGVDEGNVRIRLDNIGGTLLQSAASVSMADIYEQDQNAHWLVRYANVKLEDNGDLVLYVNTQTSGLDTAQFYSFFYHVSVKVVLDTATIAGTIRWTRDLAEPVGTPLFAITAYTQTFTSGTGGGFGSVQQHVEAGGVEGTVRRSDDGGFEVPYTISGPLVGKTVWVAVQPDKAQFGPPSGSQTVPNLAANEVGGYRSIDITNSNLHVTGVDFTLDEATGPPK